METPTKYSLVLEDRFVVHRVQRSGRYVLIPLRRDYNSSDVLTLNPMAFSMDHWYKLELTAFRCFDKFTYIKN